jgi:hypothetical protein
MRREVLYNQIREGWKKVGVEYKVVEKYTKSLAELEKIPPETRWAIAGRAYWGHVVALWNLLNETMGVEEFAEINNKMWAESGKSAFPYFKETFNLPLENAVDALHLLHLIAYSAFGPEFENEVEESPERVVNRCTKCVWQTGFEQQKVPPEGRTCPEAHQAWAEEGFKALDPRITHRLTKAMPLGDPYCEYIIEFKK